MAAARDFIAGAISSFKEAWPGLINHTITKKLGMKYRSIPLRCVACLRPSSQQHCIKLLLWSKAPEIRLPILTMVVFGPGCRAPPNDPSPHQMCRLAASMQPAASYVPYAVGNVVEKKITAVIVT